VVLCLAALAATAVAGERHAIDSLRVNPGEWRDYGWIDRAVGADARVVALWPTAQIGPQPAIDGAWADEFFNRSVRDVTTAGGTLPDGLPVETLTIGKRGCVQSARPLHPQYAVLEGGPELAAPLVAVSPRGQALLYRLDPGGGCLARLNR